MPDIEQVLSRLGALPVPVGLAEIDDAVFADIARSKQEATTSSRLMGLTVAFALVMGMVGGGIVGSEPANAQPSSPFAPDSPLAPSTLLAVHP